MTAVVNDPTGLGLRRFLNALKIMRSIDEFELSDAGAIKSLVEWRRFRADPYGFLLHADDDRAHRSWLSDHGCRWRSRDLFKSRRRVHRST